MVSIEDLFPFDPELGYLGILVISFVFSLIPFVPVPYFPVLITASFNPNFNPHIIAIVSAGKYGTGTNGMRLKIKLITKMPRYPSSGSNGNKSSMLTNC